MFYMFHKKNVIDLKESYEKIKSMSKAEKKILFAFIEKEKEIEINKNNSLAGGETHEFY